MTLKSSLLYASRLLFSSKKSNGRKSLLGSMFCIGISLIPLIAVLCVSDGMIKGITGRIIGLSSQDISVVLAVDSLATENIDSFTEYSRKIENIDGVEKVFLEINNTALASANNFRTGSTVRAVENDIFTKNEAFANLFSVIEGSVELTDDRSAIICQKLAKDLNLKVGDRISLVSANKIKRKTIVPKTVVFTVQGIVSCGYQELDALWIFIPLSAGFSFLPRSSSEYIVKVSAKDSFSTDLIKTKYEISEFDSTSDVYTWTEMNKSQFENFSSTKILLLLIMLLIVLVASINISSALVMVVLERRKEIAILKSIGGSRHGISFAFLIMGVLSGIGGLIIGLPLGILSAINVNSIISASEKVINFISKLFYLIQSNDIASYNDIHLLNPEYYLQNIPISIPVKDIIIISVGTIVLSLAASVFPSIKAGKEKPLDTLRKL